MCLQRGGDVFRLDLLLVQVVVAILVDAEHLIGLVVFRMVLDVLRLRRIGVESRQQCRRDHHEDDQQHQHDVHHRRHVRRGLNAGTTSTRRHCHSTTSATVSVISCEIGPPLAAALNSRVKRDRPNSPDTPLMR